MRRQHLGIEEERMDYEQLDDNEMITCVHQGDSQALDFLIRKYRGFVRAKAGTYFLVGADHEDIVQEGMIGLYKAIRDFKNDRRSSFRAFADLCVTRQIITAIKTATRQKHIPLNSYISLDKPMFEEESERTLMDVIANVEAIDDPQELLINREDQGQVEGELVKMLSGLEREVLTLYLDGRTYQEISVELNRHIKSIDNALQRVKKKLERYLDIAGIKL
ncbi:RNA polymerase sporulation-specific sigma factor [Amphibacillus marinus]|uniref:RNA polymerase sigma factor SigS n=1 Tax=Amphibacillus marinus TaxID=872970 RepID=A0A1H8SEH4_9BACI|nr:RNA polymerase sporulation sigma factor SigH [Amphibacillus marinus]SEO76916.1 RNA polymerase sporulation-specific sigma factor [Amphibacillus marinus]